MASSRRSTSSALSPGSCRVIIRELEASTDHNEACSTAIILLVRFLGLPYFNVTQQLLLVLLAIYSLN